MSLDMFPVRSHKHSGLGQSNKFTLLQLLNYDLTFYSNTEVDVVVFYNVGDYIGMCSLALCGAVYLFWC